VWRKYNSIIHQVQLFWYSKKVAVISFVLEIGIPDCLFHATIVIRGSKIKALFRDDDGGQLWWSIPSKICC